MPVWITAELLHPSRRMVPEPTLDLLRVATVIEQHRRARVPDMWKLTHGTPASCAVVTSALLRRLP